MTVNGNVELTRDECIRLLGRGGVGRVGLSIASLPVVVPVNFVLDDPGVVFRSSTGSRLDVALADAVVCFEVGHVDSGWQSSWSVLVTGMARGVPDGEVSREARMTLVPWAASPGERFVAIALDLVAGRQVGPVLLGPTPAPDRTRGPFSPGAGNRWGDPLAGPR